MDSPLSQASSPLASPITHGHLTDMTQLLHSFSEMLAAGLAQNASQITSSIKADLKSLGSCMDAIELAVDSSTARTNQNTACIQMLQV